jgi:hypothetical protein
VLPETQRVCHGRAQSRSGAAAGTGNERAALATCVTDRATWFRTAVKNGDRGRPATRRVRTREEARRAGRGSAGDPLAMAQPSARRARSSIGMGWRAAGALRERTVRPVFVVVLRVGYAPRSRGGGGRGSETDQTTGAADYRPSNPGNSISAPTGLVCGDEPPLSPQDSQSSETQQSPAPMKTRAQADGLRSAAMPRARRDVCGSRRSPNRRGEHRSGRTLGTWDFDLPCGGHLFGLWVLSRENPIWSMHQPASDPTVVGLGGGG